MARMDNYANGNKVKNEMSIIRNIDNLNFRKNEIPRI